MYTFGACKLPEQRKSGEIAFANLFFLLKIECWAATGGDSVIVCALLAQGGEYTDSPAMRPIVGAPMPFDS